MILFFLPATLCAQQKPGTFTNPDDAGPDFKIQGEYVGTIDTEKFAAQVVALGDGKFDVYFLTGGLPGARWDTKGRVKVSAATKDNVTTLTMAKWTGEIKDGAITGKTPEGGVVNLKRVERQSPTAGEKPPESAKILFDGKNADAWGGGKIVEENLLNCGTNSKENFGFGKLHIEFRTPFQPKARSQGRGNSGVYLMGREIQVLDSFGLKGENNECGGFYGSRKPDVNMCLPPLTWQTYDVEIKPTEKGDGALVTVWHNGIKIHENYEIKGAKPAKINLQNHGNPVVYRNIWFVPRPAKTS
jgi:hypothetical protein